jgi:hypothetical protein
MKNSMQKRANIKALLTPERFNQALQRYKQPVINFKQVLRPGETIDHWMEEFKAANHGGYLLHATKKGMRTKDYLLWHGSSKQAVLNQNIINIYDALKTGIAPKIVNPFAFQNVLRTTMKRFLENN